MESWQLKGKVLVACNCDWGCPCNFNARPTTGKCEGGWTWHVDTGSYGGVRLDTLSFSVYANWPGAIHEGKGEAVLLLDERADAGQYAAIESLLSGKIGGPWEVLGWTWPTVHGPYAVSYDLTFAGVKTRARCGDYVEIESAAIKNPVTGAESFPSVVVPQGIIFKHGDLGMTTRFQVSKGVSYDHSGKYMAVGPFDYSWAAKP
jgi:hypothetical protein